MDKKQIYHIIEWVVALAACAYLIWKIATYDDYAGLWATLRSMDIAQICALLVCVALMPVNMALEAWRWQTLMNSQFSAILSFREAQRQVYYSKLAGLITPWRLGEYPARGVLMSEKPTSDSSLKGRDSFVWPQVLSMGVVGSATMTAVIIIAGVAAMIMYDLKVMISNIGPVYLIGVAIILALLVLSLWFAPKLLRRWAVVSHRLVAISLGQSFARLLCWCVQLALVLWALGAVTGYGVPVVGAKTFVYYLFVTITPNVPIAEAGVRGAWAIAVFGTMNAALAGVLLWVINTLLPCLIAIPGKRSSS